MHLLFPNNITTTAATAAFVNSHMPLEHRFPLETLQDVDDEIDEDNDEEDDDDTQIQNAVKAMKGPEINTSTTLGGVKPLPPLTNRSSSLPSSLQPWYLWPSASLQQQQPPSTLPIRRTSWKELRAWTEADTSETTTDESGDSTYRRRPSRRSSRKLSWAGLPLEPSVLETIHSQDDEDDNHNNGYDDDTTLKIVLEDSETEDSDVEDDEEDLLVESDPVDGSTPQPLAVVRFSHKHQKILQEVDVETYMEARAMTTTQEKWNALTMIPSPLFCLYFILSGQWAATSEYMNMHNSNNASALTNDIYQDSNDTTALLQEASRDMCSLDAHGATRAVPLTVWAVAIGIILHAPFSFIYHWKYAHYLPIGSPRTHHWSRRMDQSMIHVCSIFLSFATSGSWMFFVLNALYNMDCVMKQFEYKVRPRRNKVRLLISTVVYTLPILQQGHVHLFTQLWLVLGIAFWLFVTYPLGGWSHAAFHMVAAGAPPLLMQAAAMVPTSTSQVCAALA
jgi:hypothetical protein